jgi:aldehyde dehydrogenase (NAD+)
MTKSRADEIDRIFAKQFDYRLELKRTTAPERAAKLRRIRDLIEGSRGAIQQALKEDFHKPTFESDFTEILSVQIELDHAIKHVRSWMRPRRILTKLDLAGMRSRIRYEPRGVVLILGPWNYPFALVMSPLVGAVAAGNCVIVKPSELTPATSALVGRLLAEIFPVEEVAVIQGGKDAAQELLRKPFDHIFFTGSVPVGKLVMESAARNLCPVTLELGGKAPAIIDETADLEQAAERVVWGKFLNGGQTCVAPDYVWIQESRYGELIGRLRARIAASYGHTAAEQRATPDLCRIINRHSFDRLTGLLKDAVERGATVEVGGQTDPVDLYIAPTVLSGVDWDMAIMTEEIFGPILPVIPYRDLDSVYGKLSRLPKPLAIYLFTTVRSRIEDVGRNTSAGGTVVNNLIIHAGNPSLPFGGVGASGIGNYHGEHGFRTFSHERPEQTAGPFPIVNWLFPPYAGSRRWPLKVIRYFGG